MKKEISKIGLVFLVILVSASLFSYHPKDPSINHIVSPGGDIHNLFGLIGAYIAGFLVDMLGFGSFLFPLSLLLSTINLFTGKSKLEILYTMLGGIFLAVCTGALLALRQPEYLIGGATVTSGGYLGIPLAQVLKQYCSIAGAYIAIVALWSASFVLMTRISFTTLTKWLAVNIKRAFEKIITCRTKSSESSTCRVQATAKKKIPAKTTRQETKEVKIKDPVATLIKEPLVKAQICPSFMQEGKTIYRLPSVNLLDDPVFKPKGADRESLIAISRLLEKKNERLWRVRQGSRSLPWADYNYL
ncbi:MAG: DNA translocase FtsK 4TM domain-containing protein [Pseudomonadota bacterium]